MARQAAPRRRQGRRRQVETQRHLRDSHQGGPHRRLEFGFESPITSFTFVDLKPDTEYVFQVRTKTAAGEGPPSFFNVRTGPEGNSGNVVPFPKH